MNKIKKLLGVKVTKPDTVQADLVSEKQTETSVASQLGGATLVDCNQLLDVVALRRVYKSINEKAKQNKQKNPLCSLPKETLVLVLDFLEWKNLMELSATCCGFFDFVFNNCYNQLSTELTNLEVKQIGDPMETESKGENIEDLSNYDSGDEKKVTEEECPGMDNALSLALRNQLKFHPSSLNNKLRMEMEQLFDPGLARMATTISARSFPLPVHTHTALSWHIMSSEENVGKESPYNRLVRKAFGDAKFKIQQPKQNERDPTEADFWVGGDAWSSDWKSEMSLGKWTPVKDNNSLGAALKCVEKTAKNFHSPTAKQFLQAAPQLVGSTKVAIWHEAEFHGVGMGGGRMLLFGRDRGCIFQWEVYSNFCGGPYSNFSCGMG